MPKHFYPLRELHKFASKIVWALLCAVLALFAFELANHPSYTDRDFRIVERVTDGSTLVASGHLNVRMPEQVLQCQ